MKELIENFEYFDNFFPFHFIINSELKGIFEKIMSDLHSRDI